VVTLEGEIGEFVNSYSFALGESATIDNDLVLVINNATEPFPPEIIVETFVRVTGRVHPSEVAINEGAQTDFGSLFTLDYWNERQAELTTAEQAGVERQNIVDYYYYGEVPYPDGFDNYTIIEVLNVENVEFLGRINEIGN
jgi:hypothetical protein